MAIPCHKKIFRICSRRVPMDIKDGNIARFVRHHHRKDDEDVQSGNKCNQSYENRSDQFFQAQRSEEREVLLYPGRRQKVVSRQLFCLPRNLSCTVRIGRAGIPERSRRRLLRLATGRQPSSKSTSFCRSRRIRNQRHRRRGNDAFAGIKPNGVNRPCGLVSVT